MIKLTDEERAEVEGFIRRGQANARNVTRAHILLKDAEGWSIERLAETFGVSDRNVIQNEPLFPRSLGEEHAQFLESVTYPQRSILEQLLTNA